MTTGPRRPQFLDRLGRRALDIEWRLRSGSGRATARDYAWVQEWEGNGYCVALVEAPRASDVLVAMLPDPPMPIGKAPEVRAWAREQGFPHYATAVEATELGGRVVSFEGNGYLATLDDVLRRLTERRTAIVLFCNVNAVMRFIYVKNRTVIRTFDPLLYDNRSMWIGKPLPEEKGLPFGVDGAMPSAFALAERISGVTLTRELLDARDAWIAVGHFPR